MVWKVRSVQGECLRTREVDGTTSTGFNASWVSAGWDRIRKPVLIVTRRRAGLARRLVASFNEEGEGADRWCGQHSTQGRPDPLISGESATNRSDLIDLSPIYEHRPRRRPPKYQCRVRGGAASCASDRLATRSLACCSVARRRRHRVARRHPRLEPRAEEALRAAAQAARSSGGTAARAISPMRRSSRRVFTHHGSLGQQILRARVGHN